MAEQKSCDEDLFCGVNKAADEKNMTDLEKKHIPVIEAPAAVKAGEPFEVTVEVGKLLAHPNEPQHFIEWIELACGDTFLARVDFTPQLSQPKVTLSVSLAHGHPLYALGRCNLHGMWEASKEIAVQ